MTLDEIRAREARFFLPTVRRLPVALVSGAGSRVRDVAGREYIDLTAGWGVTSIGHCHPRLVEAICRQAGQLMQTTNAWYTLPQLDLAERLGRRPPVELSRSFFVNSGAEAMEGAIKLAHRATGRRVFVSTEGSFHGRTLGALGLIGQERHRAPYRALLPEPVIVPFGSLEAAEAVVDDEVAAVVVEPIQGEGGVRPAPPGYLAGLRKLCDRSGALLILDEIQTGVGRTGSFLAVEDEGVVPDILTLGKGLGGGFPIAAFLCTEAVASTVEPGDHGGTYAGAPLGCAAALAVLDVLDAEGLVARARELGERLLERLQRFAGEHPGVVREVRGRGLLLGLELTDGRGAPELPLRAIERGVLVNLTAGRVLRLFPALNIPEDELFDAVDRVLDLAAQTAAASGAG